MTKIEKAIMNTDLQENELVPLDKKKPYIADGNIGIEFEDGFFKTTIMFYDDKYNTIWESDLELISNKRIVERINLIIGGI